MLQKIRDRAQGPLAWIIVGIISIPFAFFGVEAFRSGGGNNDVAKVGDEEISDYQLRQQTEQRYQQLQEMLGENFRPEFIDRKQLRGNVLENLIEGAVLRQHMKQAGYRATDAQVLEFVRSQQAFQQDGKFSAELYRSVVGRQGQSPAAYEDRVREFLTAEQLRAAIADSSFAAPGELAEAYRLNQQTRSVAWRRYDSGAFAQSAEITDEQVAARYAERKAAYTSPERVRLQYLELDRTALASDIQASADKLRSIYDAEKASRFTVPEERKARHILIRATDDGSAKEQIRKLADDLAGGADFGLLATEHSEDPGSGANGGDLGWVRRGAMVAPFEEALFKLQPGQVSAPVETSFGWHLIRLDELRAAKVQAFEDEDVQERLLQLHQDRESRARMRELGDQLEQLVFENPASLEPAAEKLGLEVQTTQWFTREGGAGLAAEEAVIEAAFSDLVLKSRENSQPIALGDRQVVLRLAEHEPQRQLELAEVREEIVAELKIEAGRNAARASAEADLKSLNSSEVQWSALASDAAVSVVEVREIGRDETGVPRAVLKRAFDMSVAAGEGRSYALTTLAGGDIAVIEVSGVSYGDWAQASEAERAELMAETAASRANGEFAALQAALRKRTKVKVLSAASEEAEPAPY